MHNSMLSNDLLMPTMPDLEELTARWSTRECIPPEQFDPSVACTYRNFKGFLTMVCLGSSLLTSVPLKLSSLALKVVHQTQLINQNFYCTLNYFHPMPYSTDLSDNDTYTFKEMLQQDDRVEFIKAMMKEIQDHE